MSSVGIIIEGEGGRRLEIEGNKKVVGEPSAEPSLLSFLVATELNTRHFRWVTAPLLTSYAVVRGLCYARTEIGFKDTCGVHRCRPE